MSPDNAHVLSVSKLVKRFGGFYALDGLSFHVASGEILGLVGPNGSGKTTAINVVSGLYAPDGGEVLSMALRLARLRPTSSFIAASTAPSRFQNRSCR
jgi:ABC-type branched-subunit amino acid transport system ATPase component